MKLYFENNEPMNCLNALWEAAGADENVFIPVKFCKDVLYIRCDNDLIYVFDGITEEGGHLLASFDANLNIEYLVSCIEHMIYKLNK